MGILSPMDILPHLLDQLGGFWEEGNPTYAGTSRKPARFGRASPREYEGRASHLVQAAGSSSSFTRAILAEKLNSFRDIADYQGKKVYFYKRAQLFASDLHGAFGGKNGRLQRHGELTAFADYKLPGAPPWRASHGPDLAVKWIK
jgi:hypothetical protein